ncbi:GNAT family N-acetyltransferase [Massilia sp.]|uniref:GNAT family N-acetyltransferase n=1 Tax=Massilia sp. TaxID=1882437 RepID=UPI0028AB98A4|nr:GNAT family N-acetyltransferase [Massilia sp.]
MNDLEFSYLDSAAPGNDELDAFARARPDGSAYHLAAWRRAVAGAYGYAGQALVARRNGKLAGMLPLSAVSRPLGKPRWISLPFCDLGGPLADSPDVADALAARARADVGGAGAAGLALRCSHEGALDEAALEGRKVRMLLGLPDSAAALMQSYPPKLRSQVRKAEKNGLTSEVASGSEAVAAFYDVYSRNMRRLGSPPHSRAWFDAIYRHYSAAGDMFIVLVRHEGKAVGAGWVLLCGDKAVIPWASTLADYNPLAPNMLLYWTIQSQLCERGVRQFDFGRSTYGEGTYKFKKQWGAVPVALDWREWDAQGVALNAAPVAAAANGGMKANLRPMIESAWQKLPLAVTNRLGPRLRRYITL